MGTHMIPARADALQAGQTFYQGKPCKRGHAGERYATTAACRECVAGQRKRAPSDAFAELLE